MALTSSTFLFDVAARLSELSVLLQTESEMIGTALGNAQADLETIRTSWHGDLPSRFHASADGYMAVATTAGSATGPIACAADVFRGWSSMAFTLATERQGSERLLASIAGFEDRGDDYPGMHNERGAARGACNEIDASWLRLCRQNADTLSLSIAAISNIRDSAPASLPVPAALLSGDLYLVTISGLIVDMQSMSGAWGGALPTYGFADIDPSGALETYANRRFEEGQNDPNLFTALETANDRDIDTANNHVSDHDWQAASTWDVAEVQARQLNEQFNLELDENGIAALSAEIMTFAWVSRALGEDPWEGQDSDDPWVNPDSAGIAESDTEFAPELNPYAEMQQPGMLEDLSVQELMVASLLIPFLASPETYDGGVGESLEDLEAITDLIFDPDAINGEDATAASASIEVVGVLPLGKFAHGFRALTELFQHGDEFVQYSDEAWEAVVHAADSGTEAFDDAVEGANVFEEATDGADDLAEVVDDTPSIADDGGETASDHADDATEAGDDVDNASHADDANLVDDAADGVDEAGDATRLTEHSDPSSAELGQNLEASGIDRPPGTAAHHIVAGGSPKAEEARELLLDFNIDINDADNGVFLPANRNAPNPSGAAVHSSLHTNAYYIQVTERLADAANRDEALEILDQIEQELLAGDFP